MVRGGFTLPVYFGVWLVKERDESLAYVRESPAWALATSHFRYLGACC